MGLKGCHGRLVCHKNMSHLIFICQNFIKTIQHLKVLFEMVNSIHQKMLYLVEMLYMTHNSVNATPICIIRTRQQMT